MFEAMLAELDIARRNLGDREILENEAAVQLSIHPHTIEPIPRSAHQPARTFDERANRI